VENIEGGTLIRRVVPHLADAGNARPKSAAAIPLIQLDDLARGVAILFVSLDVRFNRADDGSNLCFGSVIQGFDVFNNPKTFPVGLEVLERSHKPQAQEL
jgi:hypothetical protein